MGFLFRLCNVTIVGDFYYLILPKLLHVSVVRPSSSRYILFRITRLTTDHYNVNKYIYNINIYIYTYFFSTLLEFNPHSPS
jgi:hypothetical protein